MTWAAVKRLLRDTYASWQANNPSRLSAAIAYYTMFSLAPLLLLAMTIGGYFFGHDAARGTVTSQLTGLVGQEPARVVGDILRNAHQSHGGIAGLVAVVTLLFGASGVFSEVHAALNAVWDVQPAPANGWKGLVRERLAGFLMVLIAGVLLLASVLLSTVLSAMAAFFANVVPLPTFILQTANFAVSFLVVTALFAMTYRVLPSTEIPWGDVWIGAAATSLLFTLGKIAIGFYLGKYAATTAYGPAGSIMAALLFVYYSAQVYLFGAEFTHVFSHRHGSRAGAQQKQAENPLFAVSRTPSVKR